MKVFEIHDRQQITGTTQAKQTKGGQKARSKSKSRPLQEQPSKIGPRKNYSADDIRMKARSLKASANASKKGNVAPTGENKEAGKPEELKSKVLVAGGADMMANHKMLEEALENGTVNFSDKERHVIQTILNK